MRFKSRTSHGQKTLPQEHYVSREMFREESERIFSRQWVYAGHVSRLPEPGSYFLYSFQQESVIVTRGRDGQIRSFHNVCRHRGTRLCDQKEGKFDGRIQCPYHAWTFALDGRLMGAPNMQDVEGFDASEYSLNYVPTVVWEGFIFLNFSQNPESFQKAFAPIYFRFTEWQISSLRMTHQITYDIAANWKLIFQNYSECYHCPTVHPLLAALTPYKASNNHLEDGPFLGGPMVLGGATASMTMDGANCAAPISTVGGDNLKLVHYYTIFPSMFLTLLPDYVMVHRAQPLSADRTLVHCEFYFHPDAANLPGYQPEKAVEFWDLTNRQDWHVCELSQQGISSLGYQPGPYSEMESLLAAFDREYLRVIHRRDAENAEF